MDQIDALVVGAGVVGLAIARALSEQGLAVIVTEREALYGSGVSSRNSEVIHAGHYYDPGTWKARLCVRGRHLLVDYCRRRQVPHRLCGKLVVAGSPAERPKLEALWQRGQVNGVEDLELIDGAQAHRLEPALRADAALLSPRTGIVDSHALMTALLADAESGGALLARRSPFEAASPVAGGWQVRTGGDERFELRTRWLVNAAGLGAQAVARCIDGLPAGAVPVQHLAKGHYFSLGGRSPFSRLIYPLPVDGGLGVHLTLDLGGQARFGPDVEWLPPGQDEATVDYAVDPSRREAFARDIRRWWPQLDVEALHPAYSGVRPKLSGPGEPAADFVISGPTDHGLPGLVNLFGIESPGLTASLALAEQVATLVRTGP